MQKSSPPIPISSPALANTVKPAQPAVTLSCSIPKELSPIARGNGLFRPVPVPAASSNPAPASPESNNGAAENDDLIFSIEL